MTDTCLVVTWKAPGLAARFSICDGCREAYEARNYWPKSAVGVEFCEVSHGRHYGTCDAPEHGARP